MKKVLFAFMLALLILPCALLFTGCRKMDTYNFACIPNDKYYSANVTREIKLDGKTSEYTFDFARTTATIAGVQCDVMYLEYSWVSGTDNTNYTLLFVEDAGKAFYLNNENEWVRDNDSYSSRWNFAYGYYNDFMYKTDVWGRNFPQDSKKVTDEYIEYTFKYDEETFRLANNEYHYLVYYYMKHNNHERHIMQM